MKMPSRTSLPNWRSILDTMATISIIATAAVVIWSTLSSRQPRVVPGAAPRAAANRPEPAPPSDPVSLEGAAIQGSDDAKIALIEYSDFQCPFCGAFARETLPELEQRYVKSGKVLVAFRNLPLATLHPFATKAAEAAECARRQGKFWQIHDRFFQNQQRLDEPSIRLSAEASGLEANAFGMCLNGQAETEIKQEVAIAQKLGVSGTPTFFVGRIQPGRQVKVVKRLSGALPFAQFQAELDAVLGPAAVASR